MSAIHSRTKKKSAMHSQHIRAQKKQNNAQKIKKKNNARRMTTLYIYIYICIYMQSTHAHKKKTRYA